MKRRADTRRRAVAPPAISALDYLRAGRMRFPTHANDNPAPTGRARAWLVGLGVTAGAIFRRIALGL